MSREKNLLKRFIASVFPASGGGGGEEENKPPALTVPPPRPDELLAAVRILASQVNDGVVPKLDQLVDKLKEGVPFPAELKRLLEEIRAKLEELASLPAPTAPAASIPAMDPRVALRSLAEALRDAEGVLNDQRLVIASGILEVDVNVRVGDAVGAQAKFHLQITPQPYE